jgi:hypothetical protein
MGCFVGVAGAAGMADLILSQDSVCEFSKGLSASSVGNELPG